MCYVALIADFNGDGRTDGVLIIWYNSGGAGYFYNLCLVLNTGEEKLQRDMVFIGDRIEIVNLKVNKNNITIVYKDRGIKDARAVDPYIKKKVSYFVQEMKLKSASVSQY